MKKILLLVLAAALLLACAGCGASAPADGAASVTFFKAGKADAAVVQTPDGVLLVDTGLDKNGDELVESLRALGVERIDALILSHFDKDHVGGADAVLAAFPVGAVYQSNYLKDSDDCAEYLAALTAAGIEPVTVRGTEKLAFGALTVVIDGPDEDEYAEDPSNNSSLTAEVTWGGTTVYFTGDAQDARLAELLAAYERPEGTLILKVPYHGHWQKTLPAFLEAVRPDQAVIPCGKDEPEDDELARTAAALESLGAQVFLTRDGDVTFPLS